MPQAASPATFALLKRLRRQGHETLAPCFLRGLEAVCRLAASGRAVGVMAIAEALGVHKNHTHHLVGVLEKRGLVTLERDGRGYVRAGTVRPAVRFVPADRLGEDRYASMTPGGFCDDAE